ncbi:MAG TPA: recombinase family protein [Acetobacteraceae bacterium]|nr:recombinase family protein [Acetobacteraceae bacterium]
MREEVRSRSTSASVPDKIHRRHQERTAMVYIRQSTVQQVERHQESTRLQYALVDRALHFGWDRPSIVVVDDDLGRSGASIEGRPGFQRLVAEVGLGRVGMVLGVEMSRLARSCRDWHQLLEICALFDTLIADADGVYDPANFNDRLLLGLKGTMSEAELHILKARMLEGKRAKARRGELGKLVPMGYMLRPSGEVVLDPDEQAQATIRLVFDLFDRFRTVGKVMRYLVDHDIQMPVRVHSGTRKGELEWHRVNRVSLHNLFSNPIYAGAYVYGRRPTDPRKHKPGRPGTGRRSCPPEEAEVFLPGHLPSYISWEQYQRNRTQLRSNKAAATGIARAGQAVALRAVDLRPVRPAHGGAWNPVLDWWHIAARFEHALQTARGLGAGAADAHLADETVRGLERAKWRLWHGRGTGCRRKLAALYRWTKRKHVRDVAGIGRLQRHVSELLGYLERNQDTLVHYAARRRRGEPISTVILVANWGAQPDQATACRAANREIRVFAE